MAHQTINNLWAGLSTNRLNFSEEEIGAGILYKGSVISNQLNGIAYNLYAMVDFMQRTGGLYNERKRYYEGNIVSVIRQDLSGPIRVEQYRCINTTDSGILNAPPILGAGYDGEADVPIFQGGVVDTQNWVRCDVVGHGETYQKRTTFDVSRDIKLFDFTIPTQIDEPSVEINGTYRITAYFNDKVTSFDVLIKGSYTKTLDDKVLLMPNRLGIASPEIEFINYRSNVTDYGEEGNFHDLMPCGLRFQYSELTNDYAIYMRIRDGLKKLTISGSGSYIDVQINRDVNKLESYVVVPVRSGGGFWDFDTLGSIEDRDYDLPVEMQYKMGLLKLKPAMTYQEADNKASPLWGDRTKETSALFSMLVKIRGNYKVPQWQGAFRRNIGENLIPGLPSNTPVRPIASLQNDAIRNITGSCDNIYTDAPSAPSVAGALATTNQWTHGLAAVNVQPNNRQGVVLHFNANNVVPTSHDNHPINVSVQMFYKAF